MDSPLSNEEIEMIKSWEPYGDEKSPLQHEVVQLIVMFSTRLLWVLKYYVELVEEHEELEKLRATPYEDCIHAEFGEWYTTYRDSNDTVMIIQRDCKECGYTERKY